jgi:transcriptional regulator GlxA family with amidase domain
MDKILKEQIATLAERYPGVEVVAGERVLDVGPLVTAGGVSAGIDLGLHLVARLYGAELAALVSSMIEYPSPNAPAAASSSRRSAE